MRALRHQPLKQIGPPFSRRRSPNLPKSILPSVFPKGITNTPAAQTRCVNAVGQGQARTDLSTDKSVKRMRKRGKSNPTAKC